MKNVLIGLAFVLVCSAGYSQPVTRQEFNDLKTRVLTLEKKAKISANYEQLPANSYRVTVNYDLPVETAVTNGKYNRFDKDITSEHFPTKCSGITSLDIEIIPFNRVITSADAIAELDTMGLRPAELHELLALGEQYPDLQREFPVVALGSVWCDLYGFRLVAVLFGGGGLRSLGLYWFEVGWGAGCRFAAVRK